jgi:uncharacterized protein (DUF433 family)
VDSARPKILLSKAANTPSYTVGRAAHYSGLSAATLSSWVFGRGYHTARGPKSSPPVIIPADPESRLLSFTNIVEAHVLAFVRRAERIRMHKVRSAVEHLRESMGIERPLVDVRFRTDGIDLFISHLGEDYQASDRERPALRGMVESQLERIDWQDAFPSRLHPFSRLIGSEAERMVAVSPLVAFGRLVITDTGVPTSVVASRFLGGERISDLESDYEIHRDKIEEALRWEIPFFREPQAA